MKPWPHLKCIIYARYWITLKIILYIVQNVKMAEAISDICIFKKGNEAQCPISVSKWS